MGGVDSDDVESRFHHSREDLRIGGGRAQSGDDLRLPEWLWCMCHDPSFQIVPSSVKGTSPTKKRTRGSGGSTGSLPSIPKSANSGAGWEVGTIDGIGVGGVKTTVRVRGWGIVAVAEQVAQEEDRVTDVKGSIII